MMVQAPQVAPLSVQRRPRLTDDSGESLVDYALLVAVVAIGLVFGILVLRDAIGAVFKTVSGSVETATFQPSSSPSIAPAGPTGITAGGNSGTSSGEQPAPSSGQDDSSNAGPADGQGSATNSTAP